MQWTSRILLPIGIALSLSFEAKPYLYIGWGSPFVRLAD